jgi:hypothetical protein
MRSSGRNRAERLSKADKTSFIHFTKRTTTDDTKAVQFGDMVILPQGSVKVLGVILDKRLAMDEHLSGPVIKGTRASLSLQAIKGTRPAQMRQLFRSCVIPVIDYAVSSWYGPRKYGVVRLARVLERVQSLGARTILRASKAVSLPILRVEACLERTKERLERKVIAHTVKLVSLPNSNPARKVLPHTLNVDRYISRLSAVCVIAKARLQRGSRL